MGEGWKIQASERTRGSRRGVNASDKGGARDVARYIGEQAFGWKGESTLRASAFSPNPKVWGVNQDLCCFMAVLHGSVLRTLSGSL
eukprot:6798673-Pyramimonas_sp.AAC.1